jgi:glycosyltransferase involved in cell wall biosynthesis
MTYISIIIPVRNEEKFIENCLNSVLLFDDLRTFEFEILIIDGMSTDRTADVIKKIIQKEPAIKYLENREIIQAAALNIGLKEAKGEWILRLDAHSEYPKNYLKILYETALRTNADNTGGIVETLPFDDSYAASVVQALTTHKFGVGNSGFRVGMKEGPADTVPYGFFKKSIFDKIGYFDERLVRAQDYEFNRRILAGGGKIWLNPLVCLKYYNQPNLFKFLHKQIAKEAPYNAYMWYLAPYTFAYRHAITAVFASGIFAGILLAFLFPVFLYLFLAVACLYTLIAIGSSLQQAIRFKKPAHAIILPLSFFLYHFLHGIGVLYGIIMLIFRLAPIFQKKEPWKNAGRTKAFENSK